MSCVGCTASPICDDEFERYSLQEDIYGWVFNCPAGFYCGGGNSLRLICCDGFEINRTFPEGSTPASRNQIIQIMVNECNRRSAFCDQDPADPPPPVDPNDPLNPPGHPVQWYYSKPFSCSYVCPDGLQFVYTLPPGAVSARSQSVADNNAKQLACSRARENRICIGATEFQCCADSSFSGRIKTSSIHPITSYSISSGSLPPGIILNQSNGLLTGTPTTGGSYTFTVLVKDNFGNYMRKNGTFCVIGITSDPVGPDADTLPDADQGTAYSVTLEAPVCATAPLSWQLASGALPDGLTLDEQTGIITGTPTESGNFTFTISVQTEAT